MTENKRLIQGGYGEQRYLHSDEIFCKKINWNINLPSEREFKNGYCIVTDKNNTAYSVDELVVLLNEFQKENEELKQDLDRYCNFSLHTFLVEKNKRIEGLQSTLAYRNNQLALMEQLIDDLGNDEMKDEMEGILNGWK